VLRWVEHTAELELEIEAASKADVFAEALAAFAELVGDGKGSAREEEILVQADDAAMLLVEWLDELIYLAETEGFVPESLASLDLGKNWLHARVDGRNGEPRHLVKGVTLHRLEFRQLDGSWRARVVLDV
jgi:SHS2 domain-containing protein